MVRIANNGSVQTLISFHRQVLKGWMISRKVSGAPKPSDQPFQLTPVHRGGVSPPRERRTQEESNDRQFSYQLQLVNVISHLLSAAYKLTRGLLHLWLGIPVKNSQTRNA